MTSVSSMNSAAVLILQQANPSTAAATASDQACAPDAILAAATGVSDETGGARLHTRPPSTVLGYRPHWPDCPAADRFKSTKPAAEAATR